MTPMKRKTPASRTPGSSRTTDDRRPSAMIRLRRKLAIGAALAMMVATASTVAAMSAESGESDHALEGISISRSSTIHADTQLIAVAWSADGSMIAGATPHKIEIWTSSGHLIRSFETNRGFPAGWKSMTFVNEDRQIVFSAPDRMMNKEAFAVWDVATGSLAKEVETRESDQVEGSYHLFKVIPGTHMMIAAGGGKRGAENLVAYDTTNWHRVWSTRVPLGANSLNTLDQKGVVVIGGYQDSVSEIDASSGKLLGTQSTIPRSPFGNGDTNGVSGSPDGRHVFVSPNVTFTGRNAMAKPGQTGRWNPEALEWLKNQPLDEVVDTKTGQVVKDLRIPGEWYFGSPSTGSDVELSVWDARDRYVAMIDHYWSLIIWQPFAKETRYRVIRVPGRTWSMSITHDGNKLAVTDGDYIDIYSIADTDGR